MDGNAKGLKVGIKGIKTEKVTENKTALAIGSGTLKVYGTPAVAAFVENVAYTSVIDVLEEGQCTVGSLMTLEHLAPTYLGGEIICETELIEIDRRRLVFSFSVCDAAGQISKGTHERFVVDCGKFVDKAKSRI